MPETIKIDHESQVPVYKQIVGQVEALVRSGEYAEGCLLPSMNELSAMLDISKETVKKAYSILRNKGFIDARQGKGFYVSAAGVSEKMSVLVLFDKLSNYKQVLFNSFAGEIGDAAEITIRCDAVWPQCRPALLLQICGRQRESVYHLLDDPDRSLHSGCCGIPLRV